MAGKIVLKMTERQARTVSMACEIVSRLYAGQVEELRQVCGVSYEDLEEIKRRCFPHLRPNQYHGITSPRLPEEARILWDIYQVLRYHLAWAKAPNTPETRKWPEQMQVIYDEPWRTSEEPLPEVEVTTELRQQPHIH